MKNTSRPYVAYFFSALAVVGVASVVLPLFSKSGTQHKPTFQDSAPAHVNVISGLGVVEPRGGATFVTPEVEGLVQEIYVSEGELVKKGDLLARLDTREEDAHVDMLLRKLACLEIQAKDALDSFATVAHDPNRRVLSKDGFQRRKYNKDLAVARVKECEAELKEAQVRRQKMEVRAPIDGMVLVIHHNAGEMSGPAYKTPLIEMGSVQPFQIKVEFDAQWVGWIHGTLKAYAVPQGQPDRKIPLTYVHAEPCLKARSSTTAVGEKVDVRMWNIIYILPENTKDVCVGQEMDVFVEKSDKK